MKLKDKTLKAMLYRLRWVLMRFGIAVVVLLVAVNVAKPIAEGYIEEQFASGAVSKGRVLLRGAQIVATEKMVDFMTPDDTVNYLKDSSNLDAITTAAKFAVSPVEVKSVSLDKRGIIDSFECVVDYEYRRYSISYDPVRDIATPELLEKLPKPDEAKNEK